MNYICGSLYILKNKLRDLDLFGKRVPRIEPSMPWYKQYSYFYYPSNEIIENLYLGSSFNAYDYNELRNKNIKVIINITDNIDNYHEQNLILTYYKYPIRDNNVDDITNILIETAQVIDFHLSKGEGILVHCYMGASRSASVIIHYLMKKNNWSYEHARTFVMIKRPLVNLSNKFDEILNKI
jgi:protein-tyrosine phosphatase